MIYIKFSDGAQGTLMKVGKRWAYTEQKLNDEAHSALLMFLPEEQVQEDQHSHDFKIGDYVTPKLPDDTTGLVKGKAYEVKGCEWGKVQIVNRPGFLDYYPEHWFELVTQKQQHTHDFKLNDLVELTGMYSHFDKGAQGRIFSIKDAAWPVVNFGKETHVIPENFLKKVEHVSFTEGVTYKVGDHVTLKPNLPHVPHGLEKGFTYPVLETDNGMICVKGSSTGKLEYHPFDIFDLTKPAIKPADDWAPGDFVMCVDDNNSSLLLVGKSYKIAFTTDESVVFVGSPAMWAKWAFIKVKPEAERIKELANVQPGDKVYCVQPCLTCLTLGKLYTVGEADNGHFSLTELAPNERYAHKYFQLKDPK